MNKLKLLILIIGIGVMAISLATCTSQSPNEVQVSLTWQEQEWARDIAIYEPCSDSSRVDIKAPFWNKQVRGECAIFHVVYKCNCIEGKLVCGPPEETIEYIGKSDCIKWPLPPLDSRGKDVRITPLNIVK